MTNRSKRAEERMIWLLRHMVTPGPLRVGSGHVTAWDEQTVDDFVAAFPEAERTLRVYLMGSNSSPMLNRAAARAKDRGYIVPGKIGTQDARSYNQRTWARTWRITPQGRAFLDALPSS